MKSWITALPLVQHMGNRRIASAMASSEVHCNDGNRSAALADLGSALKWTRALGHGLKTADIQSRQASLMEQSGDSSAAVLLLESSLSILVDKDRQLDAAEIQCRLARLYGPGARSTAALESASLLFGQAQDYRRQGRVFEILADSSESPSNLDYLVSALEIWAKLDDADAVSEACRGLDELLRIRQDTKEEIGRWEQVLSIVDRDSLLVEQARIHRRLADIFLRVDQRRTLRQCLHRAGELFEKAGELGSAADCYLELAMTNKYSKGGAVARSQLQRSADLWRRSGNYAGEKRAHKELYWLSKAHNRPVDTLHEALQLLDLSGVALHGAIMKVEESLQALRGLEEAGTVSVDWVADFEPMLLNPSLGESHAEVVDLVRAKGLELTADALESGLKASALQDRASRRQVARCLRTAGIVLDSAELKAVSYQGLAFTDLASGHIDDALENADELVDLARADDSASGLCLALQVRFMILFAVGDLNRCEQDLREAFDLAKRENDPDEGLLSLMHSVAFSISRQDWPEAIAAGSQAQRLASEGTNDTLLRGTSFLLSFALSKAGQHDEALITAESVTQFASEDVSANCLFDSSLGLARVQFDAGDYLDAESTLRQGLKLAIERADFGRQGITLNALALTYLELGRSDAARETLNRAEGIAASNPELRTLCQMTTNNMGLVEYRDKNFDEALRRFVSASGGDANPGSLLQTISRSNHASVLIALDRANEGLALINESLTALIQFQRHEDAARFAISSAIEITRMGREETRIKDHYRVALELAVPAFRYLNQSRSQFATVAERSMWETTIQRTMSRVLKMAAENEDQALIADLVEVSINSFIHTNGRARGNHILDWEPERLRNEDADKPAHPDPGPDLTPSIKWDNAPGLPLSGLTSLIAGSALPAQPGPNLIMPNRNYPRVALSGFVTSSLFPDRSSPIPAIRTW